MKTLKKIFNKIIKRNLLFSPRAVSSLILSAALLGAPLAASAQTPRLFLDPGGHTSVVRQVLYMPDGKHIISVGNDKSIRVWDTVTGKQVGSPIYGQVGDDSQGQLLTAALDRDGKRLAVAGRTYVGALEHDPTRIDRNRFAIRVFRLDDLAVQPLGTPLEQLLPHADDVETQGHINTIFALAFSPDGQRLASGSADESVLIWDLKGGKCKSMGGSASDRSGDDVTCLAWSPNGRRIASGSRDKMVRLYDAGSGDLLKSQDTGGKVRCLAWSPTTLDGGKTLLIGTMSDDENTGSLTAWDLNADKMRVLSKQGKPVSCVAYSRDGGYIALGQDIGDGGPCQVRLWPTAHIGEADAGRALNHDSAIQSVAFAPVGGALVSGTNSGDVFLWNLADVAAPPRHLGGTGGPATDVRWAADGKTLTWKSGGETHVYQLDLANCLTDPAPRVWPGIPALKDGTGRSLSIAADGRSVTVSGRSELSVPDSGMPSYNNDFVRCETFNRDGTGVVVGSNLFLRLFNASTGRMIRQFTGHSAAISSVAVSMDGKYLASSSDDQTVRIWSLMPGEVEVKPIVSVFADSKRNYVIWTPTGYYAGSPNGQTMIGWQRNQGDAAEAAYDYAFSFPVLRRQDVLGALWKYGGDITQAIGAVGAPDTSVGNLKPPAVTLLDMNPEKKAATDTLQFSARLTPGSSPLARIQVAVNSHPVLDDDLADVRGQLASKGAITRKWTVSLRKGQNNLISVTAYDQPDDAKSQPTSGATFASVYCSAPPAPPHKPRLTVLAIGVKRYLRFLDLLYPDKDAEAIVKDFQDQEGNLFEKVTPYTLTNKNATKKNILEALDKLKAAAPDDNDYTVVFVAGHGGQTDPKHYYFLPYDVDTSVDADTLDRTAINWDDFYGRLKSLPGHVFLFLDTCHSAGAVTDAHTDTPIGLQTNNVAYSEFISELAAEDKNKTSSVITLASCEPTESSQDLSKFKHGAFAEALIEGLRAANNPADPVIDPQHIRPSQVTLSRLYSYISQTVRSITGAVQHPMIAGTFNLNSDGLPLANVSPAGTGRTARR